MTEDLKKFSVTYEHDGEFWLLDIYAKDLVDAQRKTHAIGMTGEASEVIFSFETRAPLWLFWPFLELHAFILNAWRWLRRDS